MRHASPQEAAPLLSKPKPTVTERQHKIVEFLKRTPDFATMRHLVLSFRSILSNAKLSSLKRWIAEAEAAGIASSAISGLNKLAPNLRKNHLIMDLTFGWANRQNLNRPARTGQSAGDG